MDPFPEPYELIWLFECEPQLTDEKIPWRYNHLTFVTVREEGEVSCEIEPGYERLKLLWTREGIEQVNLDLHWVMGLQVLNGQGVEALVASFRKDNSLRSVTIQLKPHINIAVSTKPDL